jgi:hypothetical protein
VTIPGSGPALRIPRRRVDLSDGTHIDLYDTSGPYTDPEATIDVHRGLEPLRGPFDALISLDLARMEVQLESLIGRRVDVVTESCLREPIRTAALREAVPV